MNCAALAAIVGAVTAMNGGDLIVLAPHPVAAAQLCYSNSGAQNSRNGEWAISMGEITVTGHTRLGNAERITITTTAPYIVFPADHTTVDVLDGQSVTVQIIAGLM